MNYYFDEKNGSVIVHEIETGRRWENYLWNETKYGFFLTKTDHLGGSVSWMLRSTSERVFLDMDTAVNPATLYLRDDESGDYWNPSYAPACNEVEDFTCEQGLAFSRFFGKRGGIACTRTIASLEGEMAEAWKVVIKNESEKVRNISVFPFCQFNLDGYKAAPHYHARTGGQTMFIEQANAVFSRQDSPYMPEDIFSGYIMGSEKVDAFEGRMESFYGTAGSPAIPRILKENKDLLGTMATARPRAGVLQNKITLAPGEEKTLYYVLGFNPKDPQTLIDRRATLMAKVETAFDGLYEKGIKQFGALRTTCPDKRIQHLMNFWVQKQLSYCMLDKKAVRDNSQFGMGILNFDIDLAKRTISECVAHQYSNGSALLNWTPGIVEHELLYSDPPFWLIFAVCEYIMESGDMAYCDEVLPFYDGGEATVYDHLLRAAEWYMREDNFGPHGITRIHHADWNDALNIKDEFGESVFLAMQVCFGFQKLSELAQRRGDTATAEKVLAFREKLVKTINEVAWNGDYYVRAFSKDRIIGDKDAKDGGKIYINPQSWAILADVVPADRLPALLKSIDDMETPGGMPICSPAYTTYDPEVGRMSGMAPGVFENGGIYNHGCAFKVMADCKIGRIDKAIATFHKMIPDGKANPAELSTNEPYVFTNCYLLNDTMKYMVAFAWMTGSSSWCLRDYYEGILGITRTYDGLRINPILPADWDVVEVQRPYRGSVLQIRIENHGGKKVEMIADGQKIEGDRIPTFADGKEHEIIVKLV
ncbi:MAG: hypothetical protein IJN34_03835 [Clostridia bacterium]|nr:hypothetical protein [Clostridia bacterium]